MNTAQLLVMMTMAMAQSEMWQKYPLLLMIMVKNTIYSITTFILRSHVIYCSAGHKNEGSLYTSLLTILHSLPQFLFAVGYWWCDMCLCTRLFHEMRWYRLRHRCCCCSWVHAFGVHKDYMMTSLRWCRYDVLFLSRLMIGTWTCVLLLVVAYCFYEYECGIVRDHDHHEDTIWYGMLFTSYINCRDTLKTSSSS